MNYDETPLEAWEEDNGADVEDRTPAKRSRTGCLTCRLRHLKCDEGKPQCAHCIRGERLCAWGIMLKFDHKHNPPAVSNHYIQRIRRDYPGNPSIWRFEDESISIASQYVGGLEKYGFSESYTNPINQHAASHSIQSIHSIHSSSNSISHPSNYGVSPGVSVSPPTPEPNPITDVYQMKMLELYVEKVAMWMDICNSTRFFSETVPVLSLTNLIIKWSIMATVSHETGSDEEGYYQECVRMINSNFDHSQDDEMHAIASIILNAYESIIPLSESQQIQGFNRTQFAFKKCGWDMLSSQTLCEAAEACTSLYLCLHLFLRLSKSHLSMDTQFLDWNHDPIDLQLVTNSVWTRGILLLVVQAYKLQEDGSIHRGWNQLKLKSRFHEWSMRRPLTMKPIAWVASSISLADTDRFPKIMMSSDLASLGQVIYHIGLFLLHKSSKETYQEAIEQYEALHGILNGLKSPSVISFASLGLIQVARYLDSNHQVEATHLLQKHESARSQLLIPHNDIIQNWIQSQNALYMQSPQLTHDSARIHNVNLYIPTTPTDSSIEASSSRYYANHPSTPAHIQIPPFTMSQQPSPIHAQSPHGFPSSQSTPRVTYSLNPQAHIVQASPTFGQMRFGQF